jgi:hypothetical protein
MNNFSRSKVFVCLLSVICVSCQHTNAWSFTEMRTGTSAFDSSRLAYQSKDKVNGMDLEFIQTKQQLYCYIQVHAQPVKNPNISLIATGKKATYLLIAHAGGHRFLLPDALLNELIFQLQSHQFVTLQLDNYQMVIDPTHFQGSFDKLQKPLSFLNLFSL